jgi:hypothetical protein
MIPGFVVKGSQSKRLLLRAVGPTLGVAPFRISGVLRNPQMLLNRWNVTKYVEVSRNRDWGSGSNVSALRSVAAEVFAFGLPDRSLDAAILADLVPGQYTFVISDEATASGVALVELYDADPSTGPSELTNFSNRGYVGAGSEVMITGFVVSPEGPMTLLIRAVGPGLAAAPFKVAGALSDPVIEIYGRAADAAHQLILENDNWSDSPDRNHTAQVAAQVQAFPLASGGRDAALVATLEPGAYTVVVRGLEKRRGVALVEVYTVP